MTGGETEAQRQGVLTQQGADLLSQAPLRPLPELFKNVQDFRVYNLSCKGRPVALCLS